MRGGCRFQPAAQRCAVQRGDERDVAAGHLLEIGLAIEPKRQPLRLSVLPILCRPAQIKAGAKVLTMAEDDPAFGFFASALDRGAQLLHDGRVEAVALVRAIKADQCDLAVEFVGDCLLFAHDFSCLTSDWR
jgi:hypothetical protein